MLIREVDVDFILLAGYLKLIPMELIRAYPRSIVNIHPSLLPAFGGKGYYGMKVHKAVIASGARYFAAFAVTLFPLFVFLNYVLWLSSSSYLFTILNTEKVSHLFFFLFSLCLVRYSGPTIHFVDEHYDTGRILAQRVVPVLWNDTAEDLAARVLLEVVWFIIYFWKDACLGITEWSTSICNEIEYLPSL